MGERIGERSRRPEGLIAAGVIVFPAPETFSENLEPFLTPRVLIVY
jgi:hypothetical protein